MPILAGRMVTEAPDLPTEVETPPTPVWFEDPGTLAATWVDPDEGEWQLSNTTDGSGWFTMNGPAGWGATPIEIVTDPLPRGGEQVRFIRSKPRRLQWPLYIGGATHQEFVQRYREIMRAFTRTTQRGKPGWLRITRPNGRSRQIACYYEEGFGGEAGENHLFARPVIQLYCPDGFWSGDRPVRAYRDFTAAPLPTNPSDPEPEPEPGEPEPTVSFFNPFMTIRSSNVINSGGGGGDGGGTGGDGGGSGGGSGEDGGGESGGTGGSTMIVNNGDVEAWPVWTIRGPMTKLTAINDTVGGRFSLTHTLLTEQIITITTNRPSVRGPGDANLTGKIDWFNPLGCELWPLLDGENKIRFQVDGAGPGTRVQLDFTPRYETA